MKGKEILETYDEVVESFRHYMNRCKSHIESLKTSIKNHQAKLEYYESLYDKLLNMSIENFAKERPDKT